ncbi:Sporulation protein YunB [compost metagenome]
MGAVGIKIPIGYISKNVILSNLGPSVKVRMLPIGSVKTNYISEFESAGINQTRHKIYLEVETSIKVIIATKSDEVQIKNTIPVAETIIVGKVPTTNLDFGK